MTDKASPVNGPDGHDDRPVTHHVDCQAAMQTCDYDDMVALAMLYCDWALNEQKISNEQRTMLMQWSADYERIAAYAGPGWCASQPVEPPPAEVFLARRLRQRLHGNED